MTLKRLLLLLLLTLTAWPVMAQTTTTGTITDPQGNPYANGTASAQKSVATGQVQPPPVNVTTNGSGTFSMSLPSPASYIFTICAAPTQIGPTGNPTPSLVCFSNVNPIAISGGSQDVSGSLNPVAKNLGPNITGVSGVVSAGTAGQLAQYAANGNVVSGTTSVPFSYLISFPAACPANQVAVQVGLTLGCASLTTAYLPLTGTWAFTGTMSGNYTETGNVTRQGNNSHSGTETFNGPVVSTNTGSHSGTETFTGLMQCKNLDGIRCVDSANAAGWAGSDIGAWINAAYADLPATGGTIMVGLGTYSQTTGVAFSTLNKFPSVACVPGTTLNWTPASGTQFLLNWGTQSGAPANQTVGSFSGCTLVATSAGNTAVGIDANGANGVASYVIEKNAIKGFGTAPIRFTFSASNPSFLMTVRENFLGSFTGTTPTACLLIDAPAENNRVFSNTMSGCAHGILFGSNIVTGDYQFYANSIDSNTIDMVNIPATAGATLRLSFRDNHFEDNSTGSCIALQMAGGAVDLDMANYIHDPVSACTTAFNVTGGLLTYKDITIQTNGVITNGILCTNATCLGITGHNVGGSGSVTNWVTTSGTGNATEISPGCVRIQLTTNPVQVCENGGSQLVTTLAGRTLTLQPTAGTFPDTPQTIANGTAAMTTALIGAGACGTTVTVAATNVVTTDNITATPNVALGANPGVLIIQRWPTAGNVNFNYCNPTAAGVTPPALTVNWSVIR